MSKQGWNGIFWTSKPPKKMPRQIVPTTHPDLNVLQQQATVYEFLPTARCTTLDILFLLSLFDILRTISCIPWLCFCWCYLALLLNISDLRLLLVVVMVMVLDDSQQFDCENLPLTSLSSKWHPEKVIFGKLLMAFQKKACCGPQGGPEVKLIKPTKYKQITQKQWPGCILLEITLSKIRLCNVMYDINKPSTQTA